MLVHRRGVCGLQEFPEVSAQSVDRFWTSGTRSVVSALSWYWALVGGGQSADVTPDVFPDQSADVTPDPPAVFQELSTWIRLGYPQSPKR